MSLLPHTTQPITTEPASYEMRGWMESVNSQSNLNDAHLRGLIFVSSIEDLPDSVSDVITLIAEYTYYFLTEVDLVGARLIGSPNTTIIGSSSENSRIKSTGLASGTALISSSYTMPIRHITLEALTIFDLDATGNADQALDWYGVNFEGSSDIGTIKNYSNFVVASLAFFGASGLVFDGEFGTIAISDTLLSGTNPGTIVTVLSTCTITRRIRINYSSIIAFGAGIGFDVSASASIPVEGYIFDTCNFSGGGTYTQGVGFTDNKSRWIENKGVANSASLTGYYLISNATVTTIASSSVPVKVLGATTEISISQRFDNTTSNRSVYEGEITRDFKVTGVLSLTSSSNKEVGIYIAKNGTVIAESVSKVTTNTGGRTESASVQVIANLVDTDYVEVFIENITDTTNITVTDMNIIIEALN